MTDAPHDLAAERSVLGAMLLDPAAVPTAAEFVDAQDFYRGAYRTLYETVRAMHERGVDVDLVTVTDELRRRGHLEDVGGSSAVADIVHDTPTAATCQHYAEIVAEHAKRRRAIDVARDVISQARDFSVDVDGLVSDATERLVAARGAGPPVVGSMADEALSAMERQGPYGWGAPWPNLELSWRVVPGWVHGVAGWRSAGKSALVDALVVGLVEEHDVRVLVWSPEGAPSPEHLLRMASIRARCELDSPSEAVEPVLWVEERVRWVDHDRRSTVPQILAAADAWAARNRLDVLVIDPFTSVEKFDGDPAEPWDRMLNRHLTRLQRWARARRVAVLMVIHPKQRDRLGNGTLPVCTSNDLHGGAMFGNQLDSLVSVWRDEQGATRDKREVDVHVQKVRHDGRGGEMGRMGTLTRVPGKGGRYFPQTMQGREAA